MVFIGAILRKFELILNIDLKFKFTNFKKLYNIYLRIRIQITREEINNELKGYNR